jgi:hypothetical protein
LNREQITKLNDAELLNNWQNIKAAFKLNLPSRLTEDQKNIFFADFINVAAELSKRGLTNFKIPKR